jgi:hypothetical protein
MTWLFMDASLAGADDVGETFRHDESDYTQLRHASTLATSCPLCGLVRYDRLPNPNQQLLRDNAWLAQGLGRVKTLERAARVERFPTPAFNVRAENGKTVRKDAAGRTRLPSLHALSEFFTQPGSWADEKEPRAGHALASSQPPTADLPWRFGQLSAVCQIRR